MPDNPKPEKKSPPTSKDFQIPQFRSKQRERLQVRQLAALLDPWGPWLEESSELSQEKQRAASGQFGRLFDAPG